MTTSDKTYTKQDLHAQLRALGAPQNRVVLVHTALRLVGRVEGGGHGLLDALIEYFTADGGLLCIPTHTWSNLGRDKPTLDLCVPESNLGALPTLAAADPRGVRSENPTHSMVVFGNRERALRFVADDALVRTPTAPESCYGKLFDEDGYVLLLGVAQDKNTFLHCVAEKLALPNRMASTPLAVTVRRPSGELCTREFFLYETDYTEDISWYFPKYDTAFRYCGCVTQGFVGRAPTALCSARGMLDTVKRIWERSGGQDPLADREPIPPKYYCEP